MRIDNRTNYDTKYLRKLFMACKKHEGTDHNVRKVTVKYHKAYWVGGYAWFDTIRVVIKLPREGKVHTKRYFDYKTREWKQGNGEPILVMSHRLAQVYIHEVGHNHNLTHKEMLKAHQIDTSWLPMPDEAVPAKQAKANLRPIKEAKDYVLATTLNS